MARKKPARKPPYRPPARPASRSLDPRKHVRAADRRTRKTGLGLTFEDIKVPVYVIAAATVIAALYIFVGRPLLGPTAQKRAFEKCFERMRDVRIAMEQNFEAENSYSVMGLYRHMKKPTDIDVEAFVDEACRGRSKDEWTLLGDIEVSQRSYRIHGVAPTSPPCPIVMTKSSYWPLEYAGCGEPPPASLLNE